MSADALHDLKLKNYKLESQESSIDDRSRQTEPCGIENAARDRSGSDDESETVSDVRVWIRCRQGGCPRDHVQIRSRSISITCLLRLSQHHHQAAHFKTTMASTKGDPDDSDADQLLAEALVQYNSEIDYIVQTTGLPMSPDSAMSKSTTEDVGAVDTSDSSTTAQQQNVPAGQGFADASMTPANDVFTSDIVSPPLPALVEDPQDETSDDDIESDDDGIEVNEDGTEATRFGSVRKRKHHAPMTEEQQRSKPPIPITASKPNTNSTQPPQ